MKNLLKLTGAAALLFLGTSCSEEFLEKEPTEFLTTDQIAEAAELNPGVVRGTLTGIYSLMIETGTGGTDNHDDFGHKGYDIYGDMLSGDMALSVSTYGWYRADITEFVAPTDFTRQRNYMVWRYYYRIIRSANTVIDALGGNDAVPELEENQRIMGQAKAIRAHSYFYLTQYFTEDYDPAAEILPIYDDLQDQNGPKVATSEIFNLIESDLNDAITLLDGYTRSGKNEINEHVAKGILAYVKGYKGEWQAVYDLTQDVITNGGFTIMSESEVLGGFNNLDTDGWMWGIDLTLDVNLGLVSWWGQVDYFSYSYAAVGDSKAIDSGLYAEIPDDDVRKGQFNINPGASTHLMPLNKFYAPERIPFGQNPMVTDYVFMRVAEMYLLHAEAAAHLGLDGEAVDALDELLSKRLPDTSYLSDLSGDELLDEIYLQTRIELWGEGKSYLALKRFKETVVRGDNHLSFVGVPIPYNDDRLTFEIPESELQNNPFIDSQND
jgi:hypothetical protein